MKIFRREQRPLFSEILDWMLLPLLVLWPISLTLTWVVAQNIVDHLFDRTLEQQALTLAQQLLPEKEQLRFAPRLAVRDLLHADPEVILHYQVLDVHTGLLAGEANFPPPPNKSGTPGKVYLRDDLFEASAVRVAYLWARLGEPGAAPRALVQVAEPQEQRTNLTAEIIEDVILPQFAVLPIIVLLAWLALTRAIKPLSRLVERIRARQPGDLSPLEETTVPLEMVPLVKSINGLLSRLQDSIGAQKRFLAEAAHQLKTPLAGLRLQADLAQRESTSPEALRHSLQQIARASMQTAHTVDQLLALARAEAGASAMQHQRCDLAQLTQDVMQECAPRAIERHIDLGYEGAEPGSPGVQCTGNPTLLREMLRNLLDNAIAYTPSAPSQIGIVTVRVRPGADGAPTVQVEDSGPGIAPDERERIFEPFYRVLGTNADGSGLGLSIAQEIARQHGARIDVEDARPDHSPPGARFTVRFPAS